MSKIFTFICLISFIAGCGIKGAPVPPQTPFYIGDGNKRIKNSSVEVNKQNKVQNKKNYKKDPR